MNPVSKRVFDHTWSLRDSERLETELGKDVTEASWIESHPFLDPALRAHVIALHAQRALLLAELRKPLHPVPPMLAPIDDYALWRDDMIAEHGEGVRL